MIRDEWDVAENDREAEQEGAVRFMTINEPFDDIEIDCGECEGKKPFKGLPPEVMAHLVSMHRYNVEQANGYMQSWIDSYPSDDDGWPLVACDTHGFFRLGGPCYGCEAEEPRND